MGSQRAKSVTVEQARKQFGGRVPLFATCRVMEATFRGHYIIAFFEDGFTYTVVGEEKRRISYSLADANTVLQSIEINSYVVVNQPQLESAPDNSERKTRTMLTNFYYPKEDMHRGMLDVINAGEGRFYFYLAAGHQASIDTDRESLVLLRNNLNRVLGQ